MSFGNGSDSRPDSGDFEEALTEIIYQAVLEDIDVEGGWDIRMEDSEELPEFAVEIVRMEG